MKNRSISIKIGAKNDNRTEVVKKSKKVTFRIPSGGVRLIEFRPKIDQKGHPKIIKQITSEN